MTPKLNFLPSPGSPFFTIGDHVRKALKENILSLSQHNKGFQKIWHESTNNLSQLLSLPKSYEIFFTYSPLTSWRLLLENLVSKHSTHLVNGAYSKQVYQIALDLNIPASCLTGSEKTFNMPLEIPEETEVIAITQTEPSTGLSIPSDHLTALKKRHPEKLIIADTSYSLPYITLDYDFLDGVIFSLDQGFGLPSGMSVVLVNQSIIDRAKESRKRSVHDLLSYHEHARRFQTPENANTLGIYLLSHVAAYLNERGIDILRRETNYKAALLYQELSQNKELSPLIVEKQLQSKTLIAANCLYQTKLLDHLLQKGITVGHGMDENGTPHLYFANYPTHSKEQVELLVDVLHGL